MQRHNLDIVSLAAGIIFILVSGCYALTHNTDLRLRWPLVAVSILLILGVGAVFAGVRRMAAQRTTTETE